MSAAEAERGDSGRHTAMFKRRARAGQSYSPLFLGNPAFAAQVQLLSKDDVVPAGTSPTGQIDLGWMLHDVACKGEREAQFFRAIARDGLINIPRSDDPGLVR